MLVNVIRQFNQAVPFLTYEIRMNGGARLTVPHPDFVFISPKGTWGIVTDAKDCPRHLSSILIEEVGPLTKRRTRKQRA